MVTRLKSLQDRAEYAFLRHNSGELTRAPSAIEFLTQLLGLEATGASVIKKNQIVILDMNDVEDEVVELVSSVTARMLFKLLRRADPRNRFHIHLLLEEAHRYIAATPSRYAVDATKGFERIAKEGRKYGMFIL
ncbi:MAG: ATPase, partial [Bryobacterales bacterium]|nr:ATPase [Bryobacterales bacterium]